MLVVNNGGTFSVTPLPQNAQSAPIYGLAASDVNGDGYDDIIGIGNNSYNRVTHGPDDALNGFVLINHAGVLTYTDGLENGFYVPNDGRSIVSFRNGQNEIAYVASVNNKNAKVFKGGNKNTGVKPPKGAVYASVELMNGQNKSAYIGYGSGYISGSSPVVERTKSVKTIIFYNNRGQILK